MEYKTERENMVADQLVRRGIQDPRVLEAFRVVPRHRFVPPDLVSQAYEDRPLSIGYEQTISQPYMVAYMTEILEVTPGMKILEIGTGSGYQTAILGFLGAVIHTVERIRDLAHSTWVRLDDLGVPFRGWITDGSLGVPEEAPYDGILVAAGAPSLPSALGEQLSEEGRLVIPIGNESEQNLEIVSKLNGRLQREVLFGCRFVKLMGKNGW